MIRRLRHRWRLWRSPSYQLEQRMREALETWDVTPTPRDLWVRADIETAMRTDPPRDRAVYEAMRTRRYRELMREHGHLVPAKPGDDRNLPCGWPGYGEPT